MDLLRFFGQITCIRLGSKDKIGAYILKTHFSWETPKMVTGKQCRPRSDAAECSV